MMMNDEHAKKRMGAILVEAHEMAQKKYDDPAKQLMHELIHAAIGLAGEHGRGRRAVALGLGISKETLDTWLCANDRGLSQASVGLLLFDQRVLGPVAHRWLIEQIALVAGRLILMPAGGGGDDEDDGDDVGRAALEIGDALGFLNMTVLQATDDDSDGGTRVTEVEERKISAAAGLVMREASDLVGTGGAI